MFSRSRLVTTTSADAFFANSVPSPPSRAGQGLAVPISMAISVIVPSRSMARPSRLDVRLLFGVENSAKPDMTFHFDHGARSIYVVKAYCAVNGAKISGIYAWLLSGC